MRHLSTPVATARGTVMPLLADIGERMDIEVYTARYEREHGHKPQGRRYWRFVLVSSSIAAGDHFLDLGEQMTYPHALARAQEVARLRKSVRIIVEP